ncbi:MAG TPA: hypothetical protein VEW11_06785 [Gaiellaceae bacterium]|nr:hypothetical protein [Gaiellaceae bacterium]
MVDRYWRRLSFETKSGIVTVGVVLVLAAGFFTSLGITGLESQPSEGADQPLAETLTVERTFTVRGVRTVVRKVRVVPRGTGSTNVLGTAVEVRTVTMPGSGGSVTVPGQVRTIVETREGQARTSVVTNERVVTDRRIVTNQRVVTEQRIVTNDRTITDVRTQEVTLPVTIVRTVTDSFPVTQTVTTTQVLTETVPPATVTVTCPPKGCG